MNDDAELLRRYVHDHSDAAFTELVRQHVDLVYGAAFRRTGGDSHRAADVAQVVFTRLAREARKLAHHPVLVAWLHTATRNAALNLMIAEQRRKIREHQAAADALRSSEPALDWERLRPVLDAAIDDLPESDRAAIVLRFLEHRPFSAIGAALRVSEDAARMRTDRALEKLRASLARRGITSTSAALATVVGAQPLLSAPAGLAATLASHSLASVAVTAGGGMILLSSLMNTSTLATAAFSAALAFGAGTYVGLMRNFDTPPPPAVETPAHSRMIASLRQENAGLKAETARLAADVSRLSTANAQLTAPTQSAAAPTVARNAASFQQSASHKATLNNLRQIAAARDQFMLEHGRPATSLDELVGETKYIRRLIPVAGENYAGVSMLPNQPMTVVDSSGASITYDPAETMRTKVEAAPQDERLTELHKRIQTSVANAVESYKASNNGRMPPNEKALLPYFATPQEGADFVELIEAQKSARR